ncbi:MAG: choice-of-anchor Q domain-containing protein, partial [Planctomycetota bacterium]
MVRKRGRSQVRGSRKTRSQHSVRRQCLIERLEQRDLLAELTVTTLADTVNGSDGVLSLREAIEQANQTPEHDTIRFQPALLDGGPATIHTSESLQITTPMTIEGPGADRLAIDGGNGADQQFDTADGFNVLFIDDGDLENHFTVNVHGLTISGGDAQVFSATATNAGGGIFSRENLTLRGMHLTGNAAQGGGGLFCGWGSLAVVTDVIDSTISGNAAAVGAGIQCPGELSVLQTTVSGNHAERRGGGIAFGQNLRVDHSTITENTAVDQGGGIEFLANDVATINHSIVAANEADAFPNLNDSARDFGTDMFGRFLGSYNLLGPGFRTLGSNNILSDMPMLGPLADNGGPTPSRIPLGGSPAIDVGDPSIDEDAIAFDQRGEPFPRVEDGDADGMAVIDIGATESVQRINAQPTFTMVADPMALEDSGTTTIASFAVFDPGHPDEVDQSVLAYHLSNLQRPELFSVAPAIDVEGTLTFTPAVDAFGLTTIDVTVQDNFGTANGGVDTSESQQLTITINPVNDAPTFTLSELPRVTGGADAQTVDGFVSSIDLGASNESQQSIQFGVAVTGQSGVFGSFFESSPRIDEAGNLTYTVRRGVLSGTATLRILARDDGGTANEGVDVSEPQFVTLSVVAADFGDAPEGFPVSRAQDGARHATGPLRLGELVDGEVDGFPSISASADDGDDGIAPIASILRVEGVTTTSSFEVIASQSGRLDAWIDFNADGDWDDPREQIA